MLFNTQRKCTDVSQSVGNGTEIAKSLRFEMTYHQAVSKQTLPTFSAENTDKKI